MEWELSSGDIGHIDLLVRNMFGMTGRREVNTRDHSIDFHYDDPGVSGWWSNFIQSFDVSYKQRAYTWDVSGIEAVQASVYYKHVGGGSNGVSFEYWRINLGKYKTAWKFGAGVLNVEEEVNRFREANPGYCEEVEARISAAKAKKSEG